MRCMKDITDKGPMYTWSTAPSYPTMLPAPGWYAEFTHQRGITFKKVIMFMATGATVAEPTKNSMCASYPQLLPMVSDKQSIVPAPLCQGFVRLVHESELEEENQDEEDQRCEPSEEEPQEKRKSRGCNHCSHGNKPHDSH